MAMMERVAFPGVIRAGRREMLRMAAGATAGLIIGRARADDRATMTFPFANGQRGRVLDDVEIAVAASPVWGT
jgi:hypothetical protein